MLNRYATRSAAGGPAARSTRALGIALAVLVAALLASAAAQRAPLPDAAVGALRDGRQAMQQALDTYDAQYPDRPLWQQAFAAGRKAVQAAPGRPEPLGFLAEAYSRANWYGPAWNTWQQYLDAGGTLDADQQQMYADTGLLMGYQAYQAGDLETAAKDYRAVAEQVPANVEANRWSGRIALERGNPGQAIPYWQAVLDAKPGDANAEYFLQLAKDERTHGTRAVEAFRAGVQAYDKGNLEKARSQFEQATQLNDQYAEAWAWLGRVAFDQERYVAAQRAYERATALAPNNDTYAYFAKESARRAGNGG